MLTNPSPSAASALAEAGLPSSSLLRLIDSLEGRHEKSTLDPHAICIMRGEKVVWEAAWRPYSLTKAALVYSASKTYTSMAIGMCEAEGLLSLDDDPGEILGLDNPHGITLRHLLTMNTGHNSETIETWKWEASRLLATKPQHAPGSHFAYNSPATFILSCVVSAVTGQRLTEYLRPRLLDPLGIGARWMQPINDVDLGASGYHLTVRDLARTGSMLAHGGVVDGAQVIPSDYVEQMQQPWSDNSGAPDDNGDARIAKSSRENWGAGYGYQVWRSREGFRLDGAYGQFSLIIPERDIVIAYQGATTETARTMAALWDLVDDWEDTAARESAALLDRLSQRTASLDSWDFADLYNPAPDGKLPPAPCWRGDDGTLRVGLDMLRGLEGFSVAVGEGGWTTTIVEVPSRTDPEGSDLLVAAPDGQAQAATAPTDSAPANLLPLAVRGDVDAHGRVRLQIVVTSSPHRILASGRVGEEVDAAWHTVPLRYDSAADIAVPRVVVETATP